ncbi:MAG: hypothetical protein ACR2MD_07835 [Aridibacter sp.]
MKFSRLGIIVLILSSVFITTNCSFYNRVMAQKNLVDGAEAYNNRKFAEAEERFRAAADFDPERLSAESRTAQLFLARTLHSEFAGNRGRKDKAMQAIEEYKKALDAFLKATAETKTELAQNPDNKKLNKQFEQNKDTVGSIVRAVASLYENLQQDDKWMDWQLKAAANNAYPDNTRANAYIALGARQNSCANDISDVEPVKKTVVKEEGAVFEFTKPESEETFNKYKECIAKGTEYIDNALKLSKDSESAWSYRTSLLVQKMRLAEMEGNDKQKEELKAEADKAKEQFQKLAEDRRKKEDAEKAAKAAEEAKSKSKK